MRPLSDSGQLTVADNDKLSSDLKPGKSALSPRRVYNRGSVRHTGLEDDICDSSIWKWFRGAIYRPQPSSGVRSGVAGVGLGVERNGRKGAKSKGRESWLF